MALEVNLSMPKLSVSPMQQVEFASKKILVKRDDLSSYYFSGNKARKLGYFLDHDFPKIKKVIGYGSVQANSLLSLAALAQLKNWQLDFFVYRIPDWLKATPIGNYAGALKLGANITEVEREIGGDTNLNDFMQLKSSTLGADTLFVPEGGRCKYAKYGIEQLANEIINYCQDNHFSKPLIMLPSGTGTTALFLQSSFRDLQLPYEVLTCACVGDNEYLKEQFSELSSDTSHWPTILPTGKKYHFSKLYPEFYQLWQQLKLETQIEFDLLYDPLGWKSLMSYLNTIPTPEVVIYIHQGGLIGNESMLPRYIRKLAQSS